MIGLFTLLRVKLHFKSTKTIREIYRKLSVYQKLPQLNHVLLLYTVHFINLKEVNASSVIPFTIVIYSEWAIRLLEDESHEVTNAFLLTLGHELTHKSKAFSSLFYLQRNKKFINWVNEVHCDFGAAEKMVNCNRKKLLYSIKYKNKLNPNSVDTTSHPSWKMRLYYAKNYDFNKDLIYQIAIDVGCTNEKLIQKVINFYNPIILK